MLFSIDDKHPNEIIRGRDFPQIPGPGTQFRMVYYPYQGVTYNVCQSDFRSGNPVSYLMSMDWTRKYKHINGQGGFLGRMAASGYEILWSAQGKELLLGQFDLYWLDVHIRECSTWLPLQSDNEFLVWCATGRMKVYRFQYDQNDEDWFRLLFSSIFFFFIPLLFSSAELL